MCQVGEWDLLWLWRKLVTMVSKHADMFGAQQLSFLYCAGASAVILDGKSDVIVLGI